jgi:hypothetical protein
VDYIRERVIEASDIALQHRNAVHMQRATNKLAVETNQFTRVANNNNNLERRSAR